jgi:hypothetical protein
MKIPFEALQGGAARAVQRFRRNLQHGDVGREDVHPTFPEMKVAGQFSSRTPNDIVLFALEIGAANLRIYGGKIKC